MRYIKLNCLISCILHDAHHYVQLSSEIKDIYFCVIIISTNICNIFTNIMILILECLKHTFLNSFIIDLYTWYFFFCFLYTEKNKSVYNLQTIFSFLYRNAFKMKIPLFYVFIGVNIFVKKNYLVLCKHKKLSIPNVPTGLLFVFDSYLLKFNK